MATCGEDWEIKSLFSKILENLDEFQRSFRTNLDYLESTLKNSGFEGSEIETGSQEVETKLQLGLEKASMVKSDESVEDEEWKMNQWKNHSVPVSTAARKTWLHRRKLKIFKHNMCPTKVHCASLLVIYKVRIRGEEPVKIRFIGYSSIFFHYRRIYKGRSTSFWVWDSGGRILDLKLCIFSFNNSSSFFSNVLILLVTTRFGRCMNFMYDELHPWNCARKVFDKTTDAYWLTLMVIVTSLCVIRFTVHIRELFYFLDCGKYLLKDSNLFQASLRITVTSVLGVVVVALGVSMASRYIFPWIGQFYSLLDPTYAKDQIHITTFVSEHQPTTWPDLYFLSNYFSRRGSLGDHCYSLHLRQNKLRSILTLINWQHPPMLNKGLVLSLPKAVFTICAGCALFPLDSKKLFPCHSSVDVLVEEFMKGEDHEHDGLHEFFECYVEILKKKLIVVLILKFVNLIATGAYAFHIHFFFKLEDKLV